MFLQVRNPRHVLSELLQNADDAGATWVRAYLSPEGVFHFEYDGADFDEDSLASLCRFGFSNKRRLHTIGFRGLGFKSTFSYGQRVEILTPTLAFGFEADRFTLPHWIDAAPEVHHISIRIAVSDPQIAQRIREDLRDWAESAVPLLFFSSVRRLELQGDVVEKSLESHGPAPHSEWLWLRGKKSHRVLRIVSQEEAFPAETLDEIRRERNEQSFDLPPCRVEVLLGLPGDSRLYAVLPTEVRPQLPFSINAPFIQDPARNGIKDPVTSPTNRWLLERAGRTAAEAMTGWLNDRSLSLAQRADAYQLLPGAEVLGDSLSQVCTRNVNLGFRHGLSASPVLLSSNGELGSRESCLGIPAELLDVWTSSQALEIFAAAHETVIAQEISTPVRSRLQTWKCLEIVAPKQIVDRLISGPPPARPETWDAVAALWAYLEANRSYEYQWRSRLPHLKVVPVRGMPTLQAQSSVLSLSRRDPSLDAAEWDFLEQQVQLVDPGWQEYLQSGLQIEQPRTRNRVERAAVLAELLGLNRHATLQQVFDVAAKSVFAAASPGEVGLKLARIAAVADLQVSEDFRFLCGDGQWRSADAGLLTELSVEFQSLLPVAWSRTRLIDSSYHTFLVPRERDRWIRWVRSGRSKLAAFPVPRPVCQWLRGRSKANTYATSRGGQPPARWYYQKQEFKVEDFDFERELRDHWEHLSTSEPDVWSRVVRAIADAWTPMWEATVNTRILDWHSGNASHVLACGSLRAAWLDRLVGLPCLPDQFGVVRRPMELLRRTPQTERFYQLKVAPFLHERFDRAEYIDVLRLLGVREQLSDAGTLLGRIKALASIQRPDRRALDDLISHYRALDQVWEYLPGDQKSTVREEYRSQKLILDDSGHWRDAGSVFQENDEALPGVAVVHRSVSGLGLWDAINVPRRPTIELALQWLRTLPKTVSVAGTDVALLRSLLAREPRRIAEECQGWLDLSGGWTALNALQWVSAGHLADVRLLTPVKRRTADISMLPPDVKPADVLPHASPIESALSLKLTAARGERKEAYPAWLRALSHGLERFCSDVARTNNTASDSPGPADLEAARRLGRVEWWRADQLEATPFLDGAAAGEPFSPVALWRSDRLYAVGSEFHYAPFLAEAMAAQFADERIRQAIRYCVARDAEFVRCYLQQHLGILAESEVPPGDEAVEPETLSEVKEVPPLSGEGDFETDVEAPHSDEMSGVVEASEKTGQGATDLERGSDPAKRGGRAPGPRDYLASLLAADGFRWDHDGSMFVGEGNRSVRKDGTIFPWVRYLEGIPVAQYWIGNRPLAQGLVIPAEVWHVLSKEPRKSWIIVPGTMRGTDVEAYSGQSILAEVEAGRLDLAQAAYHLSRRAETA